MGLCISLLSFGNSYGQKTIKFNKKGQHKNVFHIKFKTEYANKIDQELQGSSFRKSKSGESIILNIKDIDDQSKKYHVQLIKRLFRPAGKFEEKHRKYGLHLWYKMEFNGKADIREVIKSYQNISSIETVEAVYDVQLADEYIESSQTLVATSVELNNMKQKKLNRFPNDPRYNEQWHYNNTGQSPDAVVGNDINLEKAWKLETGNKQVIVAIEDTGFDITHPDLKGNLWINKGEIPGNGIDDDNNGYVDDIHGYNFADDTGNIPAGKHGTHVAGTISAETNNGIGVSGIAGGTGNNDGVRLMSNVIFGERNKGGYAESLIYAADNGAVISQNSWIYSVEYMPETTRLAIDYFIANAGGKDEPMEGGTVIFAAGNEYTERIIYPAGYDPVLSVASMANSGKKAHYSSYGKWVDISAPGGDITISGTTAGVLSTLPDNSYGFNHGTSMACPHASGVAALVASKYAGKLSGSDLRHLLENSTDPIDDFNPDYVKKLGSGKINALKALQSGNADVNAPSDFIATEIGAYKATINWKSVDHTARYRIRYRKIGGQWIENVINNSNIKLRNLTRSTTYEIQARSESLFKVSEYSPIWRFSTIYIGVPQNISISSITGTSAKISWESVEDADKYSIRYRIKGDINWKYLEPINKVFQTIKGLSTDSSYELQLKASNEISSSIYSKIIPFSTIDDGSAGCNGIPIWESNKIYAIPQQKIVYQRVIYKNQWYTQNDTPGSSSVWLKVGKCNPVGNIPPKVIITTPMNGQLIEQEILSEIILSAKVSDSDGFVDSVQFEINNKLLASGNNISWLPEAFGTYIIKVTVTDNEGATVTHEVEITIRKKIAPPYFKVFINSLIDSQVIEQSSFEAITLSVEVSGSDGTIDKIQFSVNNTNLAQGNNIDWTPTAYGTYTIKVEVTDSQGATAVDIITITVKEEKGNQPPELTMVTPVNGQIFEQDVFKPIALKVNATDSDGTIESIQFSVNNIDLEKGNDKKWMPESYGDHIVKVVVTDDKQATTSKQITITIKKAVTNEGCEGIAVWDATKEYKVAGLQVVHKKNIYESKWWTKNEEPGTGGPWGPWKLIRACSEVQNFMVSPNPVQNRLKLQANILPKTNVQVSISTLTGELIKEEVLKTESNSLSFDVSSLQKGIYVLKIKTQQYTQTQKILIE
ncbi:S8 family serine peptidase [Tenacibaculum sp. 190524A02b]